ncbi:MAG: glycoside hydrolase family 127 protein [Bryobacterales bacterium]|nr:glycoside hydrolase family 127 protein [Bryobacterales bacterium]
MPTTRRAFATSLAAATGLLAQQPPSPPAEIYPPARKPLIPESEPFAAPAPFARRPVAPKVRPFPLTQVKLLPGPLQQSAVWNRAYMGRLPAGRLTLNFRANAGLPITGPPFGGWEAPKSELRGHFTGHYLSACALHYAATGDNEIRARGEEIVAELARCQKQLAAGGYLSAFPLEFFDRLQRLAPVWAPFYTVHKIMAGLLDMHLHCGSRQALDVVTGMAEWADAWSAAQPPPHMQNILRQEYGGMNDILYQLAAATGEDRWARTADRFNKHAFFNPLASRRDELRNLHANTHIPQVIGAASRYELSGDPRFRDVASFFWETVATGRTYATGGTSNTEFWLGRPGQLAAEWSRSADHQECCCAYNMMKLTRQLYSWTGDPRYMDYYERNLINHRLGAIQPETGRSIYFLSMTPGAWKSVNSDDHSFWCCTGSALEEFAKLADTIYHRDAQGIYVNLFAASELDAKDEGIRLRQDTKFPAEPSTTLTVQAAPAKPWTLRIRVPAWCQSAPTVRLNGRALESSAAPGSYLSLTRAWKQGDRVELGLPMALTAEPFPDDPSRQAFLYGPVVLAGELGKEGLTDELVNNRQSPQLSKAPLTVAPLAAKGATLTSWIKPSGNAPLHFRTTGQGRDIALSPLNELWQRFAVYWHVA